MTLTLTHGTVHKSLLAVDEALTDLVACPEWGKECDGVIVSTVGIASYTYHWAAGSVTREVKVKASEDKMITFKFTSAEGVVYSFPLKHPFLRDDALEEVLGFLVHGSLPEKAAVFVPRPPEPPVRGSMLNGLNRDWFNWYRDNHPASGSEAVAEGLRRLELEKQAESGGIEVGEKEPPLQTDPSSDVPSRAWVDWCRAKKDLTFREAVAQGKELVQALRQKQEK